MKTLLRWTWTAVLVVGSAPSQETLSDSALERLKAATVYIRTSGGSGTGFIIRRDGRTALVLTCAHVVHGSVGKVMMGTWNAGTAEETTVPLKLAGIDLPADVAVLTCEIKEPPTPVPL